MLESDSENNLLCALGLKAIGVNANSRWTVNGRLKELEEDELYFKNTIAVGVLEEIMGYRGEWEEDGNRNYVYGTVVPPAWLDAWTGCVVTTMNTDLVRERRKRTLFSTL